MSCTILPYMVKFMALGELHASNSSEALVPFMGPKRGVG